MNDFLQGMRQGYANICSHPAPPLFPWFPLGRDCFPGVQGNLKGLCLHIHSSIYSVYSSIANFIIHRHVTHQDVMLSVDSYMRVAITCN